MSSVIARRGDEAPPDSGGCVVALIATGVYFIGEWGGGDADKEKLITDVVDDQVDLTGRAFLGVTLDATQQQIGKARRRRLDQPGESAQQRVGPLAIANLAGALEGHRERAQRDRVCRRHGAVLR